MKNESITATRTPRNSGSVFVNLLKSSLKNIGFGLEIMLSVWWNFEGVIHWEFVPNERTVDADLYSQQLERVHEIFRRRYPALANRNRVLLQQDNARPHTVRKTTTEIQELGGFEPLPHPKYKPDLAPSYIICFYSWPISWVEEISKTLKVEMVLTEFFA